MFQELSTRAEFSSRAVVSASLRHPLLSEEDEKMLLMHAKLGDPEAIDELVRCNQKLVASIVRKYNVGQSNANDLEVQDLFQAGNMGLLKAIGMWDFSKNVNKFSTYAFYWIRSYVRRLAMKKASSLSVSYSYSEKLVKIRRAMNDVYEREHREAIPEEIAELAGVTLEEVQYGIRALRIAESIETNDALSEGKMSDRENRTDIIDDSQNTEQQAIDRVLFLQVQKELGRMPEKTQKIVSMYFGLDGGGERNLSEIARMCGMTRQGVTYTITAALARIKNYVVRGQPHLF